MLEALDKAFPASATGREMKEEYIDKITQQLKEWPSRIDDLESLVTGTSAGMKAAYEVSIRELKQNRDALALKLRELGVTSGDAWNTLKAGIEAAKKDLKEAIAAARINSRRQLKQTTS